MDAFVTLGEHLEKEGFSQLAAKRLLSQGGPTCCLVVPLLVASVGVPTKGAGSLREVIELDCKGKLTYRWDSRRHSLEFSEVKSSMEGKSILLLLMGYAADVAVSSAFNLLFLLIGDASPPDPTPALRLPP